MTTSILGTWKGIERGSQVLIDFFEGDSARISVGTQTVSMRYSIVGEKVYVVGNGPTKLVLKILSDRSMLEEDGVMYTKIS